MFARLLYCVFAVVVQFSSPDLTGHEKCFNYSRPAPSQPDTVTLGPLHQVPSQAPALPGQVRQHTLIYLLGE